MAKRELTALSKEHFYQLLNNELLYYEDYNQYYKISNQITLENIIISEDLILQYGASMGIVFINCDLQNITINLNLPNLSLTNTKVEKIHLQNKSIDSFYADKSCKINDAIELTNAAVENGIIDCHIKQFEVSGANSRRIQFTFNNKVDNLVVDGNQNLNLISYDVVTTCLIKNSVYFFNLPYIENLVITHCNFTNSLLTGVFRKIHISNCDNLAGLQNLICLKDIEIKECKSKSTNFTLSNVYVGNTLLIDNVPDLKFIISKPEKNFTLINSLAITNQLNNIEFKSKDEDVAFYINSITFKNFNFAKDSVWMIDNVRCSNFSFINFKNFGTGNIDNTKGGFFEPMEVSYHDLVNSTKSYNGDYKNYFDEKHLIKYDSQKEKSLTFRQSDFGELNFINTDFSDFRLNYYSTKLNEIFLAGSRMPKTVEALSIEGADLFQQQRIANVQLKNLHEQHGDMVAANGYFANEMNAYYSSLKLRGKDSGEKLQLWLNKISSNHGQNWLLALKMTIIVSICLYCIFCLTLGFYPASPLNINNLGTFYKLVGYYSNYINPVHKFEDFKGLVAEEKISTLSRIFDSISRIFISYFIYQLIQAFRKHSRTR